MSATLPTRAKVQHAARERRQGTLPCTRFFWAVLDGSRLPGRTATAEQLGFLLESLVPRPIEELHVRTLPLGGQRYLACALPLEVLEKEVDSQWTRLVPASLPAFLTDRSFEEARVDTLVDALVDTLVDAQVDAADLNFLTGAYTPAPVRRMRRATWSLAALLVLLALSVVTAGLERRVLDREARRKELDAAAAQLYEESLGAAYVRSPLPPALQLEAELRTLRRTRATDTARLRLGTAAPGDAALWLSDLLRAWPRDVYVETESVHVTQDALHASGLVPDSAVAENFSAAFAELSGWTMQHPSVRSAPLGVQVTLRLDRAKEQP